MADQVLLLGLELRPSVVVEGDPGRVQHHEIARAPLPGHHAVVELIGRDVLDPAAGHGHGGIGVETGRPQERDAHGGDVLAHAAPVLHEHVGGMEREALALAHGLPAVADVLGHPVVERRGDLHGIALPREPRRGQHAVHVGADLLGDLELVPVHVEEPLRLRLPIGSGGHDHLGREIGLVGLARLHRTRRHVLHPPRRGRAVRAVGSARIDGTVVLPALEALGRGEHERVALLDDGHLGLHEHDVEVLAGHGGDVPIVFAGADALPGVRVPRRRRVVRAGARRSRPDLAQEGVVVALPHGDDLDAVPGLEPRELEHLDPVAPIDGALGSGEILDVRYGNRNAGPVAEHVDLGDLHEAAPGIVSPLERGPCACARLGEDLGELIEIDVGDAVGGDAVHGGIEDDEPVRSGVIGSGARLVQATEGGGRRRRSRRDGPVALDLGLRASSCEHPRQQKPTQLGSPGRSHHPLLPPRCGCGGS